MIKHEIYVSREKSGMGHNNAAALIKKAAAMALDAEGVDRPCLISVMLTDNEGIRETNRDFRGIDAATDVLSFPLNELTPGEFDAALCDTDPYTGAVMLGDMMISLENAPCRARSSVTALTERSATSRYTVFCICSATITSMRAR